MGASEAITAALPDARISVAEYPPFSSLARLELDRGIAGPRKLGKHLRKAAPDETFRPELQRGRDLRRSALYVWRLCVVRWVVRPGPLVPSAGAHKRGIQSTPEDRLSTAAVQYMELPDVAGVTS